MTGSVTASEARIGSVAAFLSEVRASASTLPRGRLIFGLDATMSRKPTWDLAANLQAEMFREAAAAGRLDLQLVFYRGVDECKATKWISDPARLAKIISTIDCRAGETQIGKILAHVQKETALLRVGAAVFVGDAMEENADLLIAKARELSRLKTPCFMFQEGADTTVQTVFRDIARSTGGAYGRFDAGAARQLSDLLKAAALYAVGGMTALEGRKDEGSVFLIGQLRRSS